jgi:hypothetical protein
VKPRQGDKAQMKPKQDKTKYQYEMRLAPNQDEANAKPILISNQDKEIPSHDKNQTKTNTKSKLGKYHTLPNKDK